MVETGQKMILCERYTDYGIVTGIEGNDPSHAVLVVDFMGLGTIDGSPVGYIAVRDLPDGCAGVTLGTVIRAEVNGGAVEPKEVHPKVLGILNYTIEELEENN